MASARIPPLSFRLDQAMARLTRRFGPDLTAKWKRILAAHQSNIHMPSLLNAVATGEYAQIDAAVNATALSQAIQKGMRVPLTQAAQAGGTIATTAMNRAGIELSFNAIHPNVINYAHTQSALLVKRVRDDTRAMIRTVVGLGAQGLATVDEQARMIRSFVGVPPQYVLSGWHFEQELRAGNIGAIRRRMFSAAEAQRMAGRIAAGTVDDIFVREMRQVYAAHLTNLRASWIARTETMAAANFGINEAWKQATQEGLLPQTAKRFWINTPDSRICRICARIPAMNAKGVGLNEPFKTPVGPRPGPPAHVSCRCTMGMVVPRPITPPTAPTPAPTLPGDVLPPGTILPPDLAVPPSSFETLGDEEILKLGPEAYRPARAATNDTFERFALERHGWGEATFTPERKRLHDAIVRKVMGDIQPVAAGEQAESVVLGGGAASGKSTVFRTPAGYVHIDVDKIRTMLPEWQPGVDARIKTISALTHEEASAIKDQILDLCIDGNYNFVLDGTGDSDYEHLARKLAKYKSKGNRLVGQYIAVDTDPAWLRQVIRANRSGRHVPEDVFRDTHHAISDVLPRAMNDGLFDELWLWDNNGEPGEHHLIAHVIDHKPVEIENEASWQRFLFKKNEDHELLRRARNGIVGASEDPRLVTNYLGSYGQEWEVEAYPPGLPRGEVNLCYKNATELLDLHPDWRYVEGVAYSPQTKEIPFLHGWLVTPEGKVIDPTWGNPVGARYFGVAYDRVAYAKRIIKTRFYGVLGAGREHAAEALASGAHDVRELLSFERPATAPPRVRAVEPWLQRDAPAAGHGFVGSEAEGEQFAASSEYKDKVYRISGTEHGAAIRDGGLKLGGGRWGDGVYFAGTPDIPATATGHLSDGVVVEGRVNVKKLLHVNAFEDAELVDTIYEKGWGGELKALQKAGVPDSEAMTQVIRKHGYDGLRIVNNFSYEHGWVASTNDWFVIYNPEDTMVTKVTPFDNRAHTRASTPPKRVTRKAARTPPKPKSTGPPADALRGEKLRAYVESQRPVTLTTAQRKAFKAMKTNPRFQGYLHDTATVRGAELNKIVADMRVLDRFMANQQVTKTMSLWRGGYIPDKLDAWGFMDRGFVSGTIDATPDFFTKKGAQHTVVRMTLRNGAHGAWLKDGDFVLSRGTAFKVTRRHRYGRAEWIREFGSEPPVKGPITVIDVEVEYQNEYWAH